MELKRSGQSVRSSIFKPKSACEQPIKRALPGADPNLSLINDTSSHGDIYKFSLKIWGSARPGAGYAGSLNASPRCGMVQHMRAFTIDYRSDCIYILSMVNWDEPKRRANIRKHKIDLADVESVFDTHMVTVEDDRESYGELRLQSLGMWHGRVVFLVWTPRGDDIAHLISCRYADRKETDDYFASL